MRERRAKLLDARFQHRGLGVAPLSADELRAMKREAPHDIWNSIVERGLSNLTPDENTVISAMLVGMSQVEIAEMIDVSPQTVSSRKQSALLKIRAYLASLNPHDKLTWPW